MFFPQCDIYVGTEEGYESRYETRSGEEKLVVIESENKKKKHKKRKKDKVRARKNRPHHITMFSC